MFRIYGSSWKFAILLFIALGVLPNMSYAETINHIRGEGNWKQSTQQVILEDSNNVEHTFKTDQNTELVNKSEEPHMLIDVWYSDKTGLATKVEFRELEASMGIISNWSVSGFNLEGWDQSKKSAYVFTDGFTYYDGAPDDGLPVVISSFKGPKGKTAYGVHVLESKPLELKGLIEKWAADNFTLHIYPGPKEMKFGIYPSTKVGSGIKEGSHVKVRYRVAKLFGTTNVVDEVSIIPGEQAYVSGVVQAWSKDACTIKDKKGKKWDFVILKKAAITGDPKFSSSVVVEYFTAEKPPYFATYISTKQGAEDIITLKKLTGILLKWNPGATGSLSLKMTFGGAIVVNELIWNQSTGGTPKISGNPKVGDFVEVHYSGDPSATEPATAKNVSVMKSVQEKLLSGEISKWETEELVVKDSSGKESTLVMDNTTQIGGKFKKGDKVKVTYWAWDGDKPADLARKVTIEQVAQIKKFAGTVYQLSSKAFTLEDENGFLTDFVTNNETKFSGSTPKLGDTLQVTAYEGKPKVAISITVFQGAAPQKTVEGQVKVHSSGKLAVLVSGKEMEFVVTAGTTKFEGTTPKPGDWVSVKYADYGSKNKAIVVKFLKSPAQEKKMTGTLTEWQYDRFTVENSRGRSRLLKNNSTRLEGGSAFAEGANVEVTFVEEGNANLALVVRLLAPPPPKASLKKLQGIIKNISSYSLTMTVSGRDVDFKIDRETRFNGRAERGKNAEVTYKEMYGNPAVEVVVIGR